MELTKEQYDSLVQQAADCANAGVVTISVDVGCDTDFEVQCEAETEGYHGDDYASGTGEYIVTGATFRVIEYTPTVYANEDTEVAVDFDYEKFERDVREELLTA